MVFPSFHQRLVSTRAAAISAVQHIGTALVRIRDGSTPALRGEGPQREGNPESTGTFANLSNANMVSYPWDFSLAYL